MVSPGCPLTYTLSLVNAHPIASASRNVVTSLHVAPASVDSDTAWCPPTKMRSGFDGSIAMEWKSPPVRPPFVFSATVSSDPSPRVTTKPTRTPPATTAAIAAIVVTRSPARDEAG